MSEKIRNGSEIARWLLLAAVTVSLIASSAATAQTPASSTPAASQSANAAPAGNAENGKKLYVLYFCWSCHGSQGRAGGTARLLRLEAEHELRTRHDRLDSRADAVLEISLLPAGVEKRHEPAEFALADRPPEGLRRQPADDPAAAVTIVGIRDRAAGEGSVPRHRQGRVPRLRWPKSMRSGRRGAACRRWPNGRGSCPPV